MDKQQLKKILTSFVMLIGVVVIGYIILTIIYRLHWAYNPVQSYWRNTNSSPTRGGLKIQCERYNKINKNKDIFTDLVLNDVNVGDNAESDILNYYNCYFNSQTVNNLRDGSTRANTNYINNAEKITTKLNTLSSNIDTLMIQLNNDILNNIGENYGRAHLLNKQREELKKQLNDLPLKNI